jgi:hypothetical protein
VGATRMKRRAIFAFLAYTAVLAGCMASQPMTEEQRASQARAEEERRIKALNSR